MTEGGRPAGLRPLGPTSLASISMMGSTKASVLPQPVRARPTMSLPPSTGARHCAWMSNSASMPRLRSSDLVGAERGKLSMQSGLAEGTSGVGGTVAAAVVSESWLLLGWGSSLDFLAFLAFLPGVSAAGAPAEG